ncbi:thiol reductant ABC exporter subunit CydC [Acidithiobacillus sp. AMEEHan]|uniref:thiol reductant ABC exporter subunit CydC n=1 Tax=Acidithiobacillus sp. AMEEHan TaxID=2994951 RepID=UPI0027E44312|nr:thiol reductant ABC exporter subunit CydC [Acidithiobacillus sp. AMEEHan]
MANNRDLWRLLRLFAPYRWWMLGGALLSLLTILANFGLMTLSGWFLASAALAGLGGWATLNQYNFFLPAAGVRAFATTRVLSRWLERIVTHEATFRLLSRLRVWFYTRIEPLAPAGLQGYRSGDLLSRLVADIDTLNNFYLRVFTPFLVAGLATLLMAGFFALYAWSIGLALLVLLALTGLLLPLLSERLGARSSAEITRIQAEMRTQIVDALQGMGEILTANAAGRVQEQLLQENAALLARQRRLAGVAGIGTAGMSFMANLTLWVILLLAIPLVARHSLPPAELPMFALGTMAAFEAVLALPLAFQFLGQTQAAARRIFEIADQEPLFPDAPLPLPEPSTFDIEINELYLRYPEARGDALRGLNLQVRQGERIAILGATGAGKSSIANLLLRFYDYQAGSARLGGRELRDYPGDQLRQYFALLSQRSHLFHSTIRDNLLLAKGDAEEDELWAALRQAQLAEFVEGLPQGLDNIVGEGGVNLSGGQARRIAIARTVLKNSPILILDEPSEGLDALTEAKFLQDLRSLMKGRTVIYITHRLLGLEDMDRIYVMAEGRIQESGSYAELLARPDSLLHRFAQFGGTLISS